MPATPVKRRTLRPWMIALAVGLVVLVAAALSTKIVTVQDAEAAESVGRFDPVEYADARFDSEIVPQIDEEAVDLASLLQDLDGGADEGRLREHPRCWQLVQLPGGVHRDRGRSERIDPPGRWSRVCPARSPFRCRSARPSTARPCVTSPAPCPSTSSRISWSSRRSRPSSTTGCETDVLAPVDPTQLEGKTVHGRRRLHPGQPRAGLGRSHRLRGRSNDAAVGTERDSVVMSARRHHQDLRTDPGAQGRRFRRSAAARSRCCSARTAPASRRS